MIDWELVFAASLPFIWGLGTISLNLHRFLKSFSNQDIPVEDSIKRKTILKIYLLTNILLGLIGILIGVSIIFISDFFTFSKDGVFISLIVGFLLLPVLLTLYLMLQPKKHQGTWKRKKRTGVFDYQYLQRSLPNSRLLETRWFVFRKKFWKHLPFVAGLTLIGLISLFLSQEDLLFRHILLAFLGYILIVPYFTLLSVLSVLQRAYRFGEY